MNKSDKKRNLYMLKKSLKKKGYDWWWHSFTGVNENGVERAFYIEYFIINPSLSPDKIVLGQLSNDKPSYFMMNVGTWGQKHRQIHEFYKTRDFIFNKDKLEIKVGDCYLSETKIKGSATCSKDNSLNKAYMSDKGTITWDLDIYKDISFNVGYGANSFFREINAFEMFWHAEGAKTYYEGTVIFDGEKYIVSKETSYGYADKNWGSDYTNPWLWISSWDLYSKINEKKLNNSVVVIGGGKPKLFRIPLKRKVLAFLYYEGKNIEFNFSKFWKKSKVIFSFEELDNMVHWKIDAKKRKHSFSLNLYCKKREMIFINYEAPNGTKKHNKLYNGGTGFGELKLYKKKKIIDDIIINHAGCEYGEYDTMREKK